MLITAELLAETLDELLLLSRTQAANATVLGDPDLLHGLLGGHLANAGQGNENLNDLGLLGDLVIAVEDLAECELARLDILLELCALARASLAFSSAAARCSSVILGKGISILLEMGSCIVGVL